MIRSQQGDLSSREALLTQNTGLIWSVIRRLGRRGYDPEDLFQIGSIGLLKAIDRFDTRYQTAFSTYAMPLILGELRRFFRDDGLIKVSRTIKEQAAQIQRARSRLEAELGCTPTVSELAKVTGLSPAEISASVAACESTLSFDAPISTDQPGKALTLQDSLPYDGPGEDERVDRIALLESVQQLETLEADLIRLRYYQNQTQSQTGKALGLSQVQVSRLEKKILTKLRKTMTQE